MAHAGVSHKTREKSRRRNQPSTPAGKHKDSSELGQPGTPQEKNLRMFLSCTACREEPGHCIRKQNHRLDLFAGHWPCIDGRADQESSGRL